jgi:hypothetical protein
MGRNYRAHRQGDAINAILAAAGYNFRLLLNWLRLLIRLLLSIPPVSDNRLRSETRIVHGRRSRVQEASLGIPFRIADMLYLLQLVWHLLHSTSVYPIESGLRNDRACADDQGSFGASTERAKRLLGTILGPIIPRH